MNVVAALLFAALTAAPVETRWVEGTLRGFPVVRQADGHLIGEGTFELRDGRTVREETVLEQHARLRQRFWSWRETRGNEALREFSVDLATGHAKARKRTKDGVDTWDENLDGTQDIPLAEPSDPIIRIELLPGAESRAVGRAPPKRAR